MCTIILIDGCITGQSLQSIEYLHCIFISFFLLSIISEPIDGKISLVEPYRAPPISVRIAFCIIGSYGGEWNVGREFLLVFQQFHGSLKVRVTGCLRPKRNIAFATRLFDETMVVQSFIAKVSDMSIEEVGCYLCSVVGCIER